MIITNVANVVSRIGFNPKETERFLKFAVVGVIGAVVDFGTFNILRLIFLSLVTPPQETYALTIAQTISFGAAIMSNFTWNRYWTYPDSRSKSLRRQFVQFTLVNFAGIIIRAPIFALTHNLLGALVWQMWPALTEGVALLIGDNLSVAFAVSVVMFWNFFVNRYWTYNDVES